MIRVLFAYLLLMVICSWPCQAQEVCTPKDKELWNKASAKLQAQQQQPLGKLIVEAGKQWLGTPYVAHTLERPDGEKLVINLREQDCTTFLESTLALAISIKKGESAFEDYSKMLQQLRYRNGQIQGYSSRLHYFTEWLSENERKGYLQVITAQLGGKPYAKPINFMSAHRTAYPALSDEQSFEEIKKTEELINTRSYTYIPKTEVKNIEKSLKDGDIIAITTSINGLDVVHVGFAIRQQSRIHLLHASLDEKKVVVSQKPLAEYLLGNKKGSGIMVGRAQQ